MTDALKVEQIARAVDPEMWEDDLPVPTRADTIAFHERRQASCEVVRRVITALSTDTDHTGYVEMSEDDTRVPRDSEGPMVPDDPTSEDTIQLDRDHAADFIVGDNPKRGVLMRSGAMDASLEVRAFRRHRLAVAAALDACQGVRR